MATTIDMSLLHESMKVYFCKLAMELTVSQFRKLFTEQDIEKHFQGFYEWLQEQIEPKGPAWKDPMKGHIRLQFYMRKKKECAT